MSSPAPLDLAALSAHMEANRLPSGQYVRPSSLDGLLTLAQGFTAVVRPTRSSSGFGWVLTHRSSQGIEVLHGAGPCEFMAFAWTETAQ